MAMLIRFALLPTLSGILTAATVSEGQLEIISGPEDLNSGPILSAGSFYDGPAGTSSDGVRVVNGVDFGDSYTPVNPSFTGGIVGGSNNGSGAFAPSLGDASLNEVLRTQAYADTLEIEFTLAPGAYQVQLLFWEPYYGITAGGGVGTRVMNIAIEGQTTVTGLDLMEEHGVGSTTQAVLYTHTVEVTDGTLDVVVSSSVDNATLAGMVISQSSGDTVPGPADVVGADDFSEVNGILSGRATGSWFDYDNSTVNGPEAGHEGIPSAWQNIEGSPVIENGSAITNNSSARRAFNGLAESRGAFSGGSDRIHTQVYFKVDMTRDVDAVWSGLSAYDGSTEKILFGVPFAANPGSGEREFAIHVLNAGALDGHTYSGVQPVAGEMVTLVGKLDYDADELSLFVNPDLNLDEASQTQVITRSTSLPFPITALRLGSGSSGGNGNTSWDDLVVATAWERLRGGPVIAADDEIILQPGSEARIQVLRNDFGDLDSSTLQVTATPTHGSATASPDGTIRYVSAASTATTDSFIYSVADPTGSIDTATVNVEVTEDGRFSTDFLNLPAEAPAATGFVLEDAFPGITFSVPNDFSSLGTSLFVTEAAGRIQLIPDVNSPTKTEFLDITDRVSNDFNEVTMKGVEPHPDYANNGHVFVTYNHFDGTNYRVRLSRFTRSSGNPLMADHGSELILIDQIDTGEYHNISTCRFGPDGYLYVGFGDGGTQNDGYDNSQHIDQDLWSCVIRIDVDQQPGNLQPNPDSDIPGSGGGNANFLVPADNPFVGVTSFNGQPLVSTAVRTEIFVTGLRNPWQFSFDPQTDEFWLADVGRSQVEEVNVFQPGDNGGWAWREGNQTGIRSGQTINGAVEGDASLTAPVHEYGRGGGAFEGTSVTGGIVYRGNLIPELQGAYVFGDYVSGNIWSMRRGSPNEIERLATEPGMVSFTEDPADGDVLMLDRGDGVIRRLVASTDDSQFPATLSDTNFFSDLETLTPNPGGHAYDINLRFWSDRADKSRWFLIRDENDSVGYSRDDPWTTPTGMVWVKHFDLELTPGNPSTKRRIETRFLARDAEGVYGVTYRWNHITDGLPQTEATLVDANGDDLVLPNQIWHFPSRGECRTCHTAAGGYGLSFNTRQLNLDGLIAGMTGNQLESLHAAGYLDQLPEPASDLPRHVRPDETDYSLEARARSYLDVNCSYCHRPGGGAAPSWDGRHSLTLDETGMVLGSPNDAPIQPLDLLVTPGDANASIIHNRAAAANGYSRMPPLATNLVDAEGVQLLADWINGEVSELTSYTTWREHHFGNTASAEGEPGANPDGDPLDNEQEYLLLTDPNDPASFWQSHPEIVGNEVRLPVPALPNRRVTVESSLDLFQWNRWDVSGNDGIPRAAGNPLEFVGPKNTAEFFRLRVEEN